MTSSMERGLEDAATTVAASEAGVSVASSDFSTASVRSRDDDEKDIEQINARIRKLNEQAAEREVSNRRKRELKQLERQAEERLRRADAEARRLEVIDEPVGGTTEELPYEPLNQRDSSSKMCEASVDVTNMAAEEAACESLVFDDVETECEPTTSIAKKSATWSCEDDDVASVPELLSRLSDEKLRPVARALAAGKLASIIMDSPDGDARAAAAAQVPVSRLVKLLWFTALPPYSYGLVVRALYALALCEKRYLVAMLEAGIIAPLFQVVSPFNDGNRLQMALWKLLESQRPAYVRAVFEARDEIVESLVKLVKSSNVAGDQCLGARALAVLAVCSPGPCDRTVLASAPSVLSKMLVRRLTPSTDPLYLDTSASNSRAKRAAVTAIVTLVFQDHDMRNSPPFSRRGALELLQKFAATRGAKPDPAKSAVARALCAQLLDRANPEEVASDCLNLLAGDDATVTNSGWFVRESAARTIFFLVCKATPLEAAEFSEARMRFHTFFIDIRKTEVDAERASFVPIEAVQALVAVLATSSEGAIVDRARVAATWALTTLAAGTKAHRRELGRFLPQLLRPLERTRRTQFKESISEAELPEAALITLFCVASIETDLRPNLASLGARLIVHAVTISCSTCSDEAATRLLHLLATDDPAVADMIRTDAALLKQLARNALDGDTPDLRQASKDLEAVLVKRKTKTLPSFAKSLGRRK